MESKGSQELNQVQSEEIPTPKTITLESLRPRVYSDSDFSVKALLTACGLFSLALIAERLISQSIR